MRIVSRLLVVAGLVGLAPLGLTTAPVGAAPVVFAGTGADAASLTPVVNAFRASLGGGLNPNVAGSFASGRREINWDGVPNNLADPNNLPPDFFNVNSPRGAVFSTPGSAVRVSANAGIAPVRFGTIDPSYPATFQTFSPQRLFTAVGSNIVDVTFFVPGSTTPATVSGFGAVFTDVDTANTTSIQFFDPAGTSLGTFFVPPLAGIATLSFLGVSFNAGERVARVRITNGNAALAPGVVDGAADLVVMDDFIYAEPQSVVSTICSAPPAVGSPLPGFNTIVAQPGVTTAGTDGPDLIYGTSGDDKIAALGGDDIVLGLGGNDQLLGDDGNDIICGGEGADFVAGGAGNDRLSGDAGNDSLSGGLGDDTLLGGPGADRLAGGDGTDTCTPGGDAGDAAAPAPSCETIT